MRKLILNAPSGVTDSTRVFRFRDGLDLEYSGERFGGVQISNTSYPNMALSPDGQKVVATTGVATQPNLFYSTQPPNEDSMFPAYESPIASFGAIGDCVACSNTHFAIGGTSPFLYVFDWETKTLQSASTTGLGRVRGMAFSSDGSKLAIVHSTAPHLRIYNTADWSYVNAATAPGSVLVSAPAGVLVTDDGKVVTATSSSPYLCVFNFSGTRLAAITSTAFVNSALALFKHPDHNSVIWAGNNSSPTNKHIGLLNLDTYVATNPFVDPGVSITSAAMAGRDIYLLHNAASGRMCSRISLDDPMVLASPGDALVSQIGSTNASFVVFETGAGKITGTVRDIDNLPAEREVLAFHRGGKYLAARALSDPLTGNYEMVVQNTQPHDVQFRIADGELLNDLFFARVEPEAL